MNNKNKEDYLSLLRLTYGKIRRITESLYITDIEDSAMQQLININNGEILEERHVLKSQNRMAILNGTDITKEIKNKYYDGIFVNKFFVHCKAQPSDGINRFTIYTLEGDLVYRKSIQDFERITYKEYKTDKDIILIHINSNSGLNLYSKGNNDIIQYNFITKQVEEVYKQVKDVRVLKRKLSERLLIELNNEDNIRNNQILFEIIDTDT